MALASEGNERRSEPLRVRHALLVLATPRALFSRVEDTGAYGWAFATLVGLVMLVGYAEVQTGLIDRGAEERTEESLAQLEATQADLVDRVALRERMEVIRKRGEFTKLLSRLMVIVFSPGRMVAACLIISSVLYAMVALTGRKPEYHTLMSICVYSGFLVLLGYVVRLAMVIHYRTTDVDTSLALAATIVVPDTLAVGDQGLMLRKLVGAALAAVDPFRIWFWVSVAIGLITTRQLGKVLAVVTCVLLALVGAGARMAMAFAAPG